MPVGIGSVSRVAPTALLQAGLAHCSGVSDGGAWRQDFPGGALLLWLKPLKSSPGDESPARDGL